MRSSVVIAIAALGAAVSTVAAGAAVSAPLLAQASPAGNLTDSTYDGKLRVPKGFKVAAYAKVARPRFMAQGPDGAVYVSQPSSGQIARLLDTNGDGAADSQTVAVSGLSRPHGMVFHDGWLYIATTEALLRVKLDANGQATAAPEKVVEYSAGGNHWTRTVIVGPDGGLYVAIGSTCNLCEEKTPDRAAVMRYDADGTNGRVFASGLRNAVGVAVNPTTHEIWVTQNERDNLAPDHQDLPPDEINILRDGANYGWPFCYGDRIPNPEYNDPSRCANTVPPAFALQAHSAPLGMAFLDKATMFPAEYRGDALVAFHGSWNRDQPTGAKVVRLRIRDGKPVGVEDFIAGWQDDSGKRFGRPVDVLVLADGSVLISDDASGTIYRVTH